MSRARKAKRAKVPPVAGAHSLTVAAIRLNRAADLLNAIDHIASSGAGEVNLGALAIAARDLIDKVIETIAPRSAPGGES